MASTLGAGFTPARINLGNKLFKIGLDGLGSASEVIYYSIQYRDFLTLRLDIT